MHIRNCYAEGKKMTLIFALVKIVEEEKYADDFMSGKLYMNPLNYFKNYEDKQEEIRGDPDEGLGAILQPQKMELKIADMVIKPSELTGPIKFRFNSSDSLNAFCMYSLNCGNLETITKDQIPILKTQLMIPDSCLEFGSICVVVADVKKFINRVKESIKKSNISGRMGLVEYYDESSKHSFFDQARIGFYKRNKFSDQKEYRIIVERITNQAEPFVLNVGDLSDICKKTTPQQLNETIKLRLPDGNEA